MWSYFATDVRTLPFNAIDAQGLFLVVFVSFTFYVSNEVEGPSAVLQTTGWVLTVTSSHN